jgi:two-component system chemotaxis response regulator CheY
MSLDVLLIDDSSVMRKVLTRALRQGGLDIGEIAEAGDGMEAMEVLDQGKGIDVILCDWNMPNMNGLDFVTQARAKGYEIPIVMVTTESGDERIQQATEAGANGFIHKPFTPDRLAEALSEHVCTV